MPPDIGAAVIIGGIGPIVASFASKLPATPGFDTPPAPPGQPCGA